MIAVVIPAYNESKTISSLLSLLPPFIADLEVQPIVVDDGSTDDTAALAARGGAYVIRHTSNLGCGAATRTGLHYSSLFHPLIIATMDADLQHDPNDLHLLVQAIIEEGADIALGQRTSAGMPLMRRLANSFLDQLTYLKYGHLSKDTQCGFKAMRRSALEDMQLYSTDYSICSEIIGEIQRLGLQCAHVPIRSIYTDYSISKGQGWRAGIRLVRSLLGV